MRPKLSNETVERVNRIAENRDVSSPVETLPYEDRLELVLDEYHELRREVEELREEVEKLRRQQRDEENAGENSHGRRKEAEKLRKRQSDPTRGKDTFEF